MNKIYAFILDLFFPNRCPICNDYIKYNRFVCKNCLFELKSSIAEDVCPKCGKSNCICCKKLFYSYAEVCFYYENTAKSGIISLKGESKNFGYYLGSLLGEKINNNEAIKDADFIVPVPMARKKLKERGYNQSYVIAKEISKKTKIKILKKALFKKNSKVQHELSAKEREENVLSFYKGKENLNGRKIIICDDVLTTGNTLNRCAELLIDMGATEVYAAVGTTTKLKKE